MLVQNMWCNGSHGISVGSLGQYKGEFDIVENIYVFNASMHNTTVGPPSVNQRKQVLTV
jgi:galacturan 1,4-alpha-galacturonidase